MMVYYQSVVHQIKKLKIIQNNTCISKQREIYLDSKEDTQSNQINGGDRKRPERN